MGPEYLLFAEGWGLRSFAGSEDERGDEDWGSLLQLFEGQLREGDGDDDQTVVLSPLPLAMSTSSTSLGIFPRVRRVRWHSGMDGSSLDRIDEENCSEGNVKLAESGTELERSVYSA